MAQQAYHISQRINIGVNKDSVNDAARKFNIAMDEIEDILNEFEPSGGGGEVITVSGKYVYCNKVSDMTVEGLELEEGQIIETAGYYKANDGGGARYAVRYLPTAALSDYPWAIDLGASDDPEYVLVYKADGTPLLDENGDYVLATDELGQYIPVLDDNNQPVMKELYACIIDEIINYRMFGAKLDGTTNDDDALVNAHKYQMSVYTIEKESERKRYTVRLENHNGIIHKTNDDPIICAGDIDLSGSKLMLVDANATWFGFYLWGDNEIDYMSYEPVEESKATYKKDNFVVGVLGNEGDLKKNSLLFLKEDTYAVRDDSGYLYNEPRYELLLHTSDGLLAQPFTEDWDKAGGEEISAVVSDYTTHEVSTETKVTHMTVSYTRLPATHYHFKGCDTMVNVSANKHCSVLWCKCHNAHISGFNFFPDSAQMHNTAFKNTMIYVWGAYNVEVSDIVGFNAAGKKVSGNNGTSGYVFRATNCLNLKLHDISVQGYWGATAMNCVKDIHVARVSINRLDIHNYFYNLYVDECNFYNHGIQIGEGRGIVRITNSNFYINELAADSYPNAHILEFNLTYGRIFEGKVFVENCNAYVKGAEQNEFDVFKIDFSPEAVSTLPHYKFPEVTLRDCHFFSYDANTYLVYFMIAGTRRCTTSTKAPSNVVDYCRDTGNDNTGTLVWQYIGRGVDWVDNGDSSRLSVVAGQVIRTYEKYLDSEGKTIFHTFHYFIVTQAGTLPTPSDSNKPTNYTGTEFTLGTATVKCADNTKWQATKAYAVNDYCFTENSSWVPVFCYKCTTAGTSNGTRPVHSTGTQTEGDDVDANNNCNWQYVDTLANFAAATSFTAGMQVTANQFIYVDGRIYKVKTGGTLRSTPPVNTAWKDDFQEGTATLIFYGKDWAPKTWWAQDCYCVSDVSGTKKVYKLVNHDGTTSGDIPVRGNALSVDGDMIWQYTTDTATKQWASQTQFYVGDIVSTTAGNNYKCIFDGRLELPHQINIENVSSNMANGDIFAFWENGTDVPTKVGPGGKWKIKIDNVEVYRFREYETYFLHTGNPDPEIDDRDATEEEQESTP